ncbi:sensor histidine kinase KdpD [Acinetobacter sp. BY419]|uniref:sensor histidine kinase n=2 Tax=unclassified Acinetobacter TaxID=196816 RepID=UPI001C230698|nr:HAMP domain-containing sensor histidine kinase [Acinetobacter sp. BY419]
MELKLLEIGQNPELLSSCRISLILGVYTSDNLLDTFCKVARKVLDVKTSIIGFHTEPYIWYSCPHGFRALHTPQDVNLPAHLQQADVVDQNHPAYVELSNHVKSLGVAHQRLVAFNLKSSQGQSLGQVVFFDDQTELFDQDDISTVQQFAKSLVKRIKLNQEHAQLKELYEQQCAQNFSKTKFFQIIAHDLRAPFHGLLGFSEVLAQERDTLDESSIQSIADYLYDNAQSTYNLLESLLTWAMAEGGRFVYHPINYELKQSSKIVCSVLKSLALKKKIELIDNIPEDIKVHADINMITSVLQNLVSNALKFTPVDQGGKVILEAEMEDEQVKITIQDTGLGMTEEQMQNLFKPTLGVSVRGTAAEKGAGLGLVLCKRFIDLNHGQIEVDSKEGRGTTFTVHLPMVTNDHQALVLEDLQAEQS